MKKTNVEADQLSEAKPFRGVDFPIVAIGASAGGLKALTELLQYMPADTGMAFVVVQHLSPAHESMMPAILSRSSKMTVKAAENDQVIEPNTVYVMPESVNMTYSEGKLKVVSEGPARERMPIDHFFHSLAQDWRNKAVSIILSGTASDGAAGTAEIKEMGGITFAQEPESAEFDSMPRNAMATGCIDFICTPKEIAEKLAMISRYPYADAGRGSEDDPPKDGDFPKILKLLQKASAIDFMNYKFGTLKRRVVRRMVLKKADSLADYVVLLEKNREELSALLQDVLIHVTHFFRDVDVFAVLKDQVYPALLRNRTAETPLRVWVVGCSTGEEVYSLAISIIEFLGDKSNDFPIQIFATDAKQSCIEFARKGLYPRSALANVSHERLRRFFISAGGEHYQIIKSIRDLCIFAKQNVLADPPYSRIDLISCRNLMIYFNQKLQEKVVPAFHYALKPQGFLILGKSESIASKGDLFRALDKKNKIYARQFSDSGKYVYLPGTANPEKFIAQKPKIAVPARGHDVFKEADRVILGKYEHGGVVINDKMEILQFRGDSGPFFNIVPGVPTANLFKLVSTELGAPLHALLQKVRKSGRSAQTGDVKIQYQGKLRKTAIDVMALSRAPSGDRFYLILFSMMPLEKPEPGRKPSAKGEKGDTGALAARVRELEKELLTAKSYLNSIIDDREATNLDLQSANEESQATGEEFQSMNEELQSTNEELETAKEELQATNEEITTINDELHNHISTLTTLTDDLQNLLTSIHLPVIMVERDLRIRRFTRSAGKVLRLIPSDIGRPLTDLKPAIRYPNLEEDVVEVMATATVRELEVLDEAGKWFLVQIRPYKTGDNRIDGAIIIMTDINDLKRHQTLLENYQIELENSNQELEQFAYIASHDLQEPMRMVSNYLGLLQARFQSKLDKEAGEFLGIAKEGAERAQKLIHDLLQYARIGTKGKSLENTDFKVVINRVLSNLTLAVAEADAQVTHDPLPQIMTDQLQMVQLFQNLIANAIKYKADRPLKIHISAARKDDYWLFSVQDNGIGIDPQHKERIFALFQRLQTKSDRPGAGIGLAVCKKIVERHGGQIWVESTPGEGSIFRFTLSEKN